MIDNFTPQECWDFVQANPNAVLIDVRTAAEHIFVGHPVGAILVEYQQLPKMQLNPNFAKQVADIAAKDTPVLLLCRSGGRSLVAAKLLEGEGWQHLINILGGFEGDLDPQKHRSNSGGWRFCGLPWLQS